MVKSEASFIIFPLDLVSKHNGSFRRIHYLSHSPNKSVNDYILGEYSAISYILLKDMLSAIVNMGRGTVIIKRDI